ncbi:MAG: 3-dehydroquinate synthase [Acidobacteriota bacterium]
MRRLDFRHPRGLCPVWVGDGLEGEALDDLAAWASGRTVFVVSAAPVAAAVGDRLQRTLDTALASSKRRVDLEVPDGEEAKDVDVATQLWRGMLTAGGKRDSGLVAIGGGSVGDLGGFVAGTFLRGIEVVQVPTTLLAQVDASVGGKTAIDLPEAKNCVGVFHYPHSVLVDTGLCATLPPAERRSGLVEAIKMAALLDPAALARIEGSLDALLAGDAAALEPVVAEAIACKLRVVEEDPEESGFRRVLNFGHTLAHAIEKALDFGTLRHGEAVAYGMLFALRLSRAVGQVEDSFVGRVEKLLGRLELPPLPELPVKTLLEAMARDKKATEDGILWVLAQGGGKPRLDVRVPIEEVERELIEFLASTSRS